MSRRLSRAGMAALFAGTALYPAMPALGGAAWHAAEPYFVAPAGQLTLVREWHRSLAGGVEIVSRRRYAVQFVRDGDGYRIEGRQIDAKVEAPAKLAALAQIEQQRSDDGMFPIRIDGKGVIVATSESGRDQRGDAGAIAAAMLSGLPEDSGERREAEAFIRRWQGIGPAGHWPADLFRPAPGHRHDQRDFALANGHNGSVEVTIEAAGAGVAGVLARFERTVVTRSEGQARTTRELWRLEPTDTPG